MKKVYVILLSIVISIPTATNAAKIIKKSFKQTSSDTTTSEPAIIAIEIVDPNENSTSSKNSKRTIDNALGYGYNSFDKPRYEVYKYSQHDIPGYKGDSRKFFKHPSTDFTPSIQKSVQYTLPTITEYTTNSALKPGTTLYSSLSSKGQVGGLRSSLAQIPELQHNSHPVPVILLRIYPDQLQDSTIHANLPEGHPFAKVVNSVNIQSLLNHYVKALKVTSAYSNQKQLAYQSPINYQYVTSTEQYQPQYPSEQNRYYQQQQYQDYSNNIQPVKYQYQYYHSSTQKPKPQYYYVPAQATEQESHQQYYQQPSQEQTYYEQQYQDYYSGQAEDQQQKLLTEENYPSNKHTRVIFKTHSGKIRTPESEESSRNRDIKTIKIHVPENVAKVEVQESERPYYGYQQEPENQEYAAYTPSPEVYVTAPTKKQTEKPNQEQESYYYNTQEKPTYDFQSLGYDEMVKYLSRRGAMNHYYYHGGKESEGEAQKSSEEMVAAYEEGFPSSTSSPGTRKVKNKKRA